MKDPSKPKLKLKHILAAGFCLQITMTVGVYLVGATEKLPHFVDTNGIAASFASDGISYRNDALSLKNTFVQNGAVAWFNVREELHVKLYSISFILFGSLLGHTILASAPLNVLYFLLILYLVFSIGKEIFDIRVGLLSAGIVSLWPSFLLHTTQLLKDHLFIIAMLTLVLMGTKWLGKNFSWRMGLATGGLAGVAGLVLRQTRSDTWYLICAIVMLVTIALVIRQLRERKILTGNMVGIAILLLVTLSAPYVMHALSFHRSNTLPGPTSSDQDDSRQSAAGPVREQLITERSSNVWTAIPERISFLRQRFIQTYPNASSNIDTETTFRTPADIIYYIPRAAAIGFFAPFPRMWFDVGNQTGRAGRIMGGLETLTMYVFELMALLVLWFRRDQIAVWLLWLVAAISLTALGLVVTNLGTLYRMRYVFWMLLIIIGVEGALRTISFFRSRRELRTDESIELPGNIHPPVDGDRALLRC